MDVDDACNVSRRNALQDFTYHENRYGSLSNIPNIRSRVAISVSENHETFTQTTCHKSMAFPILKQYVNCAERERERGPAHLVTYARDTRCNYFLSSKSVLEARTKKRFSRARKKKKGIYAILASLIQIFAKYYSKILIINSCKQNDDLRPSETFGEIIRRDS